MITERIRGLDDNRVAIAGDITHGPFATPIMKKLLQEFGRGIFGRSSVCGEFQSFLISILPANSRDMVALEIGTYYGISAAILAQHFKEVICVTKDDTNAKEMRKAVFKTTGARGRVRCFDIHSMVEKQSVIEGLDFDFAYNDGDHQNEAEFDFQLTKKCGRVMFHEAWPIQPACWNMLHALPPNEVRFTQFDSLAYWEAR